MIQKSKLFNSLLILKRRKSLLWILLFFSLTSLTTYSIQLYNAMETYYNPPSGQFNYFMEVEEHSQHGFIVNTPSCRIFNISAWDKSIIPLLNSEKSPSTSCKRNHQWTYVQENNLVLNESAIKESGYSPVSLFCCYRAIRRVEQNVENYDKYADSQILFDRDCKRFEGVTPVDDEFVRVICKYKYWPYPFDILYRYFHVFALPNVTEKTKAKFEFWGAEKGRNKDKRKNEKKSAEIPPNVLLLGIDSMSRLSFERNMEKTRNFLKEIGAHEMRGYTKVGENTYPNSLAFTTGYQEEDVKRICLNTQLKMHDPCPWIWKRFDSASYISALFEDVPLLATFNYLKLGFVKKPTDYYLRPFMLAVHEHTPSMFFTIDCIGKQTVDEALLRYIQDLHQMTSKRKTPLFLYTWLTNLAHGNLNAAKFSDSIYFNALQNMNLNNTILFFMSDHGYRYGSIRQTFPGWLEDKLPNLWVYLPPNIRLKYPEWESALATNSERLMSPFDIYHTLTHILSTFTQLPKLKDEKTPESTPIPRKFGKTMFEEIDEMRKCEDAGISDNFCACIIPKNLSINDSLLLQVGLTAVEHINELLPVNCKRLKLESLTAGAVMEKTNEMWTYIVAFITTPGQFLFEANVDFNVKKKTFKVSTDILRMNKITTDVNCVHDSFFEKYCYC